MEYIPRKPDRNVNVTRTSPLRDFFTMLIGAGVILVAVYVVLGLLVDFLVPRISPETEQKLSGFFQNKYTADTSVPEESKSLQVLVDRMQKQCVSLPYPMKVEIAGSDMINALALPGGRIVVFSGLLEKVQSENELAFVLAHEMGHFANRDHLSGIGRGLVFMALSLSLFGPNNPIGDKIASFLEVSELGFSRKHETMADEYALEKLDCLYGHVAGATGFFELTSKMEENNFAGHYLSTHPLSEKRITHLTDLAGEKGFRREGELVPYSFVP